MKLVKLIPLNTDSELVIGYHNLSRKINYTLSLPAGFLPPLEGVFLRPAAPLTLPRLSMTFAPAPPPPREAALPLGAPDFLAPPPEGRDTAFDDGRCSSERRGRTPFGGRLKSNRKWLVLSLKGYK